jgi:four helix bundle protein
MRKNEARFCLLFLLDSGFWLLDSSKMMKRAAAKDFRDLIVWQKAHEFVLSVYRESESYPKNELYGLTSQMRRAAVSVPANIAEGFKKKTLPEKARFLNIAQGSLEECRYYLILAKDLDYGDTSHLMTQLEETSKLLEGYISKMIGDRSHERTGARIQKPEFRMKE